MDSFDLCEELVTKNSNKHVKRNCTSSGPLFFDNRRFFSNAEAEFTWKYCRASTPTDFNSYFEELWHDYPPQEQPDHFFTHSDEERLTKNSLAYSDSDSSSEDGSVFVLLSNELKKANKLKHLTAWQESIPGYSSFEFPAKKSVLSKEQMTICYNVLKVMASFKNPSAEQMAKLREFKTRIEAEQNEFLMLAEMYWTRSFHVRLKEILPQVEEFVNMLWQKKLNEVRCLPRFYFPVVTLPMCPKSEETVDMIFVKTLSTMGTTPPCYLPLLQRYKVTLNSYFDEISQKYSEHQNEDLKPTLKDSEEMYHSKVSEDKLCETLAKENSANVVMCGATFTCLVDNHMPFMNRWHIPFTVKEHIVGTKKHTIIFFDKPLGPKSMSQFERKEKYFKIAAVKGFSTLRSGVFRVSRQKKDQTTGAGAKTNVNSVRNPIGNNSNKQKTSSENVMRAPYVDHDRFIDTASCSEVHKDHCQSGEIPSSPEVKSEPYYVINELDIKKEKVDYSDIIENSVAYSSDEMMISESSGHFSPKVEPDDKSIDSMSKIYYGIESSPESPDGGAHISCPVSPKKEEFFFVKCEKQEEPLFDRSPKQSTDQFPPTTNQASSSVESSKSVNLDMHMDCEISEANSEKLEASLPENPSKQSNKCDQAVSATTNQLRSPTSSFHSPVKLLDNCKPDLGLEDAESPVNPYASNDEKGSKTPTEDASKPSAESNQVISSTCSLRSQSSVYPSASSAEVIDSWTRPEKSLSYFNVVGVDPVSDDYYTVLSKVTENNIAETISNLSIAKYINFTTDVEEDISSARYENSDDLEMNSSNDSVLVQSDHDKIEFEEPSCQGVENMIENGNNLFSDSCYSSMEDKEELVEDCEVDDYDILVSSILKKDNLDLPMIIGDQSIKYQCKVETQSPSCQMDPALIATPVSGKPKHFYRGLKGEPIQETSNQDLVNISGSPSVENVCGNNTKDVSLTAHSLPDNEGVLLSCGEHGSAPMDCTDAASSSDSNTKGRASDSCNRTSNFSPNSTKDINPWDWEDHTTSDLNATNKLNTSKPAKNVDTWSHTSLREARMVMSETSNEEKIISHENILPLDGKTIRDSRKEEVVGEEINPRESSSPDVFNSVFPTTGSHDTTTVLCNTQKSTSSGIEKEQKLVSKNQGHESKLMPTKKLASEVDPSFKSPNLSEHRGQASYSNQVYSDSPLSPESGEFNEPYVPLNRECREKEALPKAKQNILKEKKIEGISKLPEIPPAQYKNEQTNFEDLLSAYSKKRQNFMWQSSVSQDCSSRCVTYNMWQLHKSVSSILSKNFSNDIKLLIRCKDGLRKHNGKLMKVAVKSECQSELGAEQVTLSEVTRQWASVIIRPNTDLLRVRVNAVDSEVIQYQELTAAQLAREALRLHEVKLSKQLASLQAVLEGLVNSKLQPGHYLLSHKDPAFATVHQPTESSSYTLSLHNEYPLTSQMVSREKRGWIPLDTLTFTPLLEKTCRIPVTFVPPRKQYSPLRRTALRSLGLGPDGEILPAPKKKKKKKKRKTLPGGDKKARTKYNKNQQKD